MIRFVDLTGQIGLDDEGDFAFFDTTTDRFVEMPTDGCQHWATIEDFENDAKAEGFAPEFIARCVGLVR